MGVQMIPNNRNDTYLTSSAHKNNKRIAKNSLLLYFRTILTITVTLYTSRVVIRVLGIDDFGIYNVVGGVVTMFSLISGSMTTAIQRFLSFELGKNDQEGLRKTFFTSITLQIILGAAIIVLAEIIGLWFINYRMNIAPDRLYAANWAFQCSLSAFFINLISIPYNAMIVAHEKMKVFAYVSIAEASLRLGLVLTLSLFDFDKLILYAILTLLVSLAIRIFYGAYANWKFSIGRGGRIEFHREILREMLGFSGWNLIGASSAVLRDQGVNILFNLFFGVTVNAARGLSKQVQGAIYSFVTNFQMAVNPQITKSYAMNDRARTKSLVKQGGKISFYLLLLISLPMFFETENILRLWLGLVPEYTMVFVRLALAYSLLESMSRFMMVTIQATGNIRNYQSLVGGIKLSVIIFTFIFLELGGEPWIAYVVDIGIELVCLCLRIRYMGFILELPVHEYIKDVLTPCALVSTLSGAILFLIYRQLGPGVSSILRISIMVLSSVAITGTIILFVGLNFHERSRVYAMTRKLRQKIQ